MIESALIAFTTFLATIGPPDVAVVFAAITGGVAPAKKRRLAVRATLIAAVILLIFGLLGKPMLGYLGISLPALRTAGGILLLLIAIELVFARSSGGTSTTASEEKEAVGRDDIAVFPLATPLMAGPGAIGAVILLVAEAEGDPTGIALVFAGLLAVLALCLVLMIAAAQVVKRLGVTGAHVLSRVFGVLLAALAVQFLFDGIAGSGLIG